MRNEGYIRGSEKAVFKALQDLGGWNTHLDLFHNRYESYDAPETDMTSGHGGYTQGGHCVWSFTDRTKRFLNRLVKKGKIEVRKLFDEKGKEVNYYKVPSS